MLGEDPFSPQDPGAFASESHTDLQPTEADVVNALAAIERASFGEREPELAATASSRVHARCEVPELASAPNLISLFAVVVAVWVVAGLVIYLAHHTGSFAWRNWFGAH